jgi:hypothetical protein
MSGSRDDREAQQARIDALEATLAGRTRELEAMRGGGSAEERLERLAKELAHAQAELARPREVVQPKPKRLAPVIASVALVALFVGAPRGSSARAPVREAPVVIMTNVPAPEVSSPAGNAGGADARAVVAEGGCDASGRSGHRGGEAMVLAAAALAGALQRRRRSGRRG